MARTAIAKQSERNNLEAHVDLCAERYNRLEQRLQALENAMQEMKEMVIAESQKSTKTDVHCEQRKATLEYKHYT